MKASLLVRTIATVIVTGVAYLVYSLYAAAMPSIEAAVAVNQVQDSIVTYSLTQAFMRSHMGGYVIFGVYALLLIVIWLGALKSGKNSDKQDN